MAVCVALELGAFVAQRRAEMKSEGAAKGGLPLELQLDGAEVAAMAAAVGDAVAALDGEHARHLVLLRASDKYLGRQEANLCQMVDHAGKMRGLADELFTRQQIIHRLGAESHRLGHQHADQGHERRIQ